MLKRTVSGAVFVAIVVGFFILRQFVHTDLMLILPYFFSVVGCFELARLLKGSITYKKKKAKTESESSPSCQNNSAEASVEVKDGLSKSADGETGKDKKDDFGRFSDNIKRPSVLVASLFGLLFAPTYYIGQTFLNGYGWLLAVDLIILFAFVTVIIFLIKGYGAKDYLLFCFPFVYPSLLILAMLLCNGFSGDSGFAAMLCIFVISPFSDTSAYLVGMTYGKIKKGKVKKLCPRLSPKKTWAGAIGGVIGGALGAIIVGAAFGFTLPWYFFLALGLIASVATETGDLFESGIKRKTGFKDAGRIMPGHGGVLDRIDGISFAAAVIFLGFLIVTAV